MNCDSTITVAVLPLVVELLLPSLITRAPTSNEEFIAANQSRIHANKSTVVTLAWEVTKTKEVQLKPKQAKNYTPSLYGSFHHAATGWR